jgi:diguanylate cyclase (GGDEF)-like protein
LEDYPADMSIVIFTIIIFFLVCVISIQYHNVVEIQSNIKNINRTTDLLYIVADKISNTNDEKEVYKYILNTAVELIPNASKGSILIMEEDGRFHFKALKGFSEKISNVTLSREEVFLHNINNFAETAIIKNPRKFDEKIFKSWNVETFKRTEALNICCTISSPIYLDGKLIGLINVDSIEPNKMFTEKDKALMNYIKNELQLALKNSFIRNKLTYLANFDELTGLYNRRYFRKLFEESIVKIHENCLPSCFVFIDIDEFKYINDTFGHSAGDDALKLFCDILRENIDGDDIYARMSGDEFVILYFNCNEESARARMEGIREALTKKNVNKISIKIDFSFGITPLDSKAKVSIDGILSHADRKMYENKRSKCLKKEYLM